MNTERSVKTRIRLTVVIILVVVVGLLAGFIHKMSKPRILNKYEMREYGAMVLDTPRQFSDFELTTHTGETFTLENLKGKWTLIFFGFTHCPDICPTTLATLNRFVGVLTPEERDDLQVVLLTVDPERDTQEKLAQYVPYFNKDFIGLTGSPYRILKLATELNIVYNKVPLEGDDYTMDHSGSVVVINPRGHFHGFFRPPFETGNLQVAWRSMRYRFGD